MNETGLKRLFWGFLFILLNFKIGGFDIFPDIVGYLFLAFGLSALAENSYYFTKASKLNIPLMILSLFTIYERPVQAGTASLGLLGWLSLPLAIVMFIINLMMVYNVFLGISDMASKHGQHELSMESDKMWRQYVGLQVAFLVTFVLIFIPPLAFIYLIGLFIAAIVITINILGFLKRCSENLSMLE